VEPPVITLLTDYGLADEYVGVCHGVILRICPAARLIDISHAVPHHDVQRGAVLLMRSLLFMPVGVHLAVVDPGVGSERRAVALQTADGRILVGPDNGLLWPVARLCGGIELAYDVSESPARLEHVSMTFHGRDIFAPVAAQIACGEPLDSLGVGIDPAQLTTLDMPEPRLEDGELVVRVVGVDEFGNIEAAADARELIRIGAAVGDSVAIECNGGPSTRVRVARTFADVRAGEALLHEDSAGWIALAVNRGSAARRFGIELGDILRIKPVVSE
jgi:S-adenosylmethionine hydrolase